MQEEHWLCSSCKELCPWVPLLLWVWQRGFEEAAGRLLCALAGNAPSPVRVGPGRFRQVAADADLRVGGCVDVSAPVLSPAPLALAGKAEVPEQAASAAPVGRGRACFLHGNQHKVGFILREGGLRAGQSYGRN